MKVASVIVACFMRQSFPMVTRICASQAASPVGDRSSLAARFDNDSASRVGLLNLGLFSESG
jgi:hypothetical protein